jgi:hypothetical protein
MGKKETIESRGQDLRLTDSFNQMMRTEAFTVWAKFMQSTYKTCMSKARKNKDPMCLAQADILKKIFDFPQKYVSYSLYFAGDIKALTDSLES